MPRTLIRIGKDTAVIIPADILERHGLKLGNNVELVTTDLGITIVPVGGVNPTFVNVLRKVSSKHGDLFKSLADFDRSNLKE